MIKFQSFLEGKGVYIVFLLLFLSGLLVYLKLSYGESLILNERNHDKLPRKFRKVERLQLSSSGQFSEKELSVLLTHLPKNSLIIDLREESHAFLNGMAVSWYKAPNWNNRGKSTEQILKDERDRVETIKKRGFAFLNLYHVIPLPILAFRMTTEEELSTSLGALYWRLPQTDHVKPSDESVDTLIDFYKRRPKDQWWHLHCSAGKGRATTIAAMIDMMQNGSTDSFESILRRQIEEGGYDLSKVPKKKWKIPYLKERLLFLKDFHSYCQENPTLSLSWSSWRKLRP